MNSEAECGECRRLLGVASVAITEQLRAIGRLDTARLHQETDSIPALETLVYETRMARESAVAAYREHRAKHASPSGEAVAAQAG